MSEDRIGRCKERARRPSDDEISVQEKSRCKESASRPSDYEVSALHFGDHTRTLNGEEISMHETYNHSERETEIDLLQDVVKRLQQEIQDMSVSRFKEQDKLIDMKSK